MLATFILTVLVGVASPIPMASPVPATSPTPPAPALFDRTLPDLTATPCPSAPNHMQRVEYSGHIAISEKSREDFLRDVGGHYGVAYLFTYLDGPSIVLVRNEAHFDAPLRELLHTYGEAIRGTPVIPGCEHIGGIFLMFFDVLTDSIRLIPVTSVKSVFSTTI